MKTKRNLMVGVAAVLLLLGCGSKGIRNGHYEVVEQTLFRGELEQRLENADSTTDNSALLLLMLAIAEADGDSLYTECVVQPDCFVVISNDGDSDTLQRKGNLVWTEDEGVRTEYTLSNEADGSVRFQKVDNEAAYMWLRRK